VFRRFCRQCDARSTWRMSVNPSARSSASATYRRARQMRGSFSSRTVVVSRVSSAADVGG
jgi:hypothetical protein